MTNKKPPQKNILHYCNYSPDLPDDFHMRNRWPFARFFSLAERWKFKGGGAGKRRHFPMIRRCSVLACYELLWTYVLKDTRVHMWKRPWETHRGRRRTVVPTGRFNLGWAAFEHLLNINDFLHVCVSVTDSHRGCVAKLSFSCPLKGHYCLYAKSCFNLTSRQPHLWIHIMLLHLQVHRKSAVVSFY